MEKNLETQIFSENQDFKTLENLLDTLDDNINPIFISREDYNDKKWENIEKTWSNKDIDIYNLYLPVDLKVWELAVIIKKINKLTFWENLPEFASSEELKIKLTFTIDYLLTKIEEVEQKDRKDIQTTIKKCFLLYQDLFSEEEANKLNNPLYRKQILSISNHDKYKEYKTKILGIKTQEWLSNLLENVEVTLSTELQTHFNESFFEKWINSLRLGMETITWIEQKSLKWKEWDIKTNVNDKELDEKARKLRDKIWIDELKKELFEARKSWIPQTIEQTELNATNKILKIVYEYPYQSTYDNYWYQPSKIIDSKELFCVWFSLLWHAFLSELWIDHKWLNIPNHSALEIIIWGKSYYFDWTKSDKIYEFSYWKKNLEYRNIDFFDKPFKKQIIAYNWDTEKILLYQICYNKWKDLSQHWSHEEAIKMFDYCITLNPELSNSYHQKGYSLSKLWRQEDAIKMFDYALTLDSWDAETYFLKGFSLNKLWKNKIWELYFYCSKLLEGNDKDVDQLYIQEKLHIKELLQKKDFEWLRLYLLNFEDFKTINLSFWN